MTYLKYELNFAIRLLFLFYLQNYTFKKLLNFTKGLSPHLSNYAKKTLSKSFTLQKISKTEIDFAIAAIEEKIQY